MLELNIDTGVQEIKLNGEVSAWLNLTDPATIERFFDAFSEMDKEQEKYRAVIETTEDGKTLFSVAREMDVAMRGKIDTAFGAAVCDPLFGGISVYALAGGLPLWCNLMLAVIDEMNSTMAAEKKKTNPALAKYTAKYKK